MAVAVAEQELLIGGKWVGAKSGKEVEQTNPYTEETVGRAAAAGTDDVDAAVKAAQGAFETPLAYGNTVILKGSELCPRTHAQIVRCVVDAGAPEGAINYLTNDPADAPEVVEALIAHPGTRRVNFTGSTKVGRIIAEKC